MATSEQMNDPKINESLNDLVYSLNYQIKQLESWLKCRHMSFVETTVEDKEQLEQIEKRITSLENQVLTMDETIKKEEETMIFVERMIECVTLHNKKISNMIQKMPNQLPIIPDHYQLPSNALSLIIQQSDNNNNNNHIFDSISLNKSPIINDDNDNRRRNGKLKRKATIEIENNPRAIKRRKKNDNNNKTKKKEIPQIEIVGKDEFNSVPKYVKGRLTQNRLNDAINEFNKELQSKYRILQMHPSKMQKLQFDLHERYIREDTKETKNCYWLNHDDFKNSTNFTFDQTGKAIFNVMRHLKRIRMISGKKPKYVVL